MLNIGHTLQVLKDLTDMEKEVRKMNWKRIWENVIIGGFLMLIGFGVFFWGMGLMAGEDVIADYQEEMMSKFDKAIDLHNEQQDWIEILRLQISQLDGNRKLR